MNIVFLGTPDFAASSLEALCASNHKVVAVVTPPDRRGNRNKLMPPAVKTCAISHGLQVYQYERISKEGVDDLRSLNADIFVTCAFGQILSREILAIPKHGVINVHASLLPKYRGSCPIQASIINGDSTTGVAIMQTEYEVDSGDVLLSSVINIDKDETSGELFDRLADVGAKALVEALDLIEQSGAVYTAQDHSKATFCHMIKKADGVIDWSKSAKEVHDFIRGMHPWPCAFTTLNDSNVKIHRSHIAKYDKILGEIGSVLSAESEIIVACGSGSIAITMLQVPNGNAMSSNDYLRGHSIEIGTILK